MDYQFANNIMQGMGYKNGAVLQEAPVNGVPVARGVATGGMAPQGTITPVGNVVGPASGAPAAGAMGGGGGASMGGAVVGAIGQQLQGVMDSYLKTRYAPVKQIAMQPANFGGLEMVQLAPKKPVFA